MSAQTNKQDLINAQTLAILQGGALTGDLSGGGFNLTDLNDVYMYQLNVSNSSSLDSDTIYTNGFGTLTVAAFISDNDNISTNGVGVLTIAQLYSDYGSVSTDGLGDISATSYFGDGGNLTGVCKISDFSFYGMDSSGTFELTVDSTLVLTTDSSLIFQNGSSLLDADSGYYYLPDTSNGGGNLLCDAIPLKPFSASSAPTYEPGLIYFDTTLNKLRVGGAAAWETITSV